MKKWFFYIAISLVFISCKQEFKITAPAPSAEKLLMLNDTVPIPSSVSVIGAFSGPIQARVLFFDSEEKIIPHSNPSMALIDSKTNGIYFKAPSQPKVDHFDLQLWMKKSYYVNPIFLNQFIIRGKDSVLTIQKNEIPLYFEFINIKFDSLTGKMTPINENQTPKMQFKKAFPN